MKIQYNGSSKILKRLVELVNRSQNVALRQDNTDKNTLYWTGLDGVEITVNIPSGAVEVDTELSETSTNPVENQAITKELAQKADKSAIPTVGDGVLSVQRNGKRVGTFSANAAKDTSVNISVPEKVSELENDAGYGTYTKPAAGIPKSDLASGVQASLGKADTALQKHQDISGKLDKTGDASTTTVAFSAASARENVKTGEKLFVIVGKIAKWFADLKTVAFTGSYNDLANKPTIPDISGKQDKLTAGTNITISGNTISAKDTTYGNASASVAGLMSATDKSKLDGLPGVGSISSLQFSNNEYQTYMGVKFSSNRVSARFLVMENNGERADIYVSIRIGIDTKAKVYVSGNTNTEYKMFYDTSNNVYVIFNCNAWSYGSCIASADNAAMSVWYGTSYPTGLTGITMDIQILLDTSNYVSYALPKDGTAKKAELLSNGQIRTAYCHNDDATFSNGYVWFKIGTATLSGGYATVTTTFLGVCGYGKHALYTCRVRATSAGNVIESISFLESGRTGGMLSGLFRVVAINDTNGISLELWAKGASRWEGTRIVILNEQNLDGGGQGNFWALTSRGNADAKTAPTSGNMYVDSSDSSICANAVNATKWSNLVADISTYNKKDTWLLVNNNGVIQHRLEGDLNVNSSKTLTDSGWIDTTRNTSFTATSTVKCRKYGQIVEVRGEVTFNSTYGSTTVCTLPAGYRPATVVQACGITPSGKQYMIKADTSGVISFGSDSRSTFVKGTTYRVDLTYLLG